MKKFCLFLLLALFPISIMAMRTEKTKVDSLCEIASGFWYIVFDCNGHDGKIQSIYLGDTVEIKRMNVTDSLSLTTFKNGDSNSYRKLAFSHFDYEMDAWIFNSSIGTDWIFYFEGDVLYIISEDNGYGYARKQLVNSVDNPTSTTGIQAFPNPSNGRVQLSEAFQGRIQILDATGRVLYQNHTPTPIRSVNLSPYPNGIYFLRLEKQGKPVLLKVIKK